MTLRMRVDAMNSMPRFSARVASRDVHSEEGAARMGRKCAVADWSERTVHMHEAIPNGVVEASSCARRETPRENLAQLDGRPMQAVPPFGPFSRATPAEPLNRGLRSGSQATTWKSDANS